MFNTETIKRNDAKKIVKEIKDIAIQSEGARVCIHKMEVDKSLTTWQGIHPRMPVYTYIVRCRDVNSARRLVDQLWNIRRK